MYDAQIGRWHVVDPLAEKYYSTGSYVYALNDPILLQDFDGRDVDPTRIQGTENLRAWKNFLSTEEGYAFIAQFMRKGQKIRVTVDGQVTKFKFSKNGSRAKDKLVLETTDHPNLRHSNAEGMTRVFSKGYKSELKDVDDATDIRGGVTHLVQIDDSYSEFGAANTLSHELFVHTQQDVNRLNSIDQQVAQGDLKPGTEEYINALQRVGNSAVSDHTRLANGEVSKYQNASAQLDKLKSTNAHTKQYNDDVKLHKRYKNR